ncbi:MAG: putative lipid II flippase FtsW [Bdellovibrionaceae bacterium]|nr:putative lipid II flippase FtsW [Pseudobdellovibrionaceae bacterium]NUM59740.1 putative lipid II flippase FtsW [Pseudobdellovibrionaceae bacterium]
MLKPLSSNLFIAILALLGTGLVQVYSSSYIFAFETYGDGLFFFKKQAIFLVLGLLAFFSAFSLPLKWVEKSSWLLWVIGFFGVVLTLIPGVGVKVGGAHRWLQLPLGIRFEPGELLKIAFVFYFSSILYLRQELFKKIPLYVLLILLVLPLVLLLKQPDFGSFSIICLTAVALLFIFGLSWKYIASAVIAAIPLFYFLVMKVDYRRARVMAFLDPWADPEHKGFQVIQSMLSFHSGGFSGVGIGQGQGKLFFLPEAHTDFTLAVFGEEMGFIGFFLLLSLYGFIIYRTLQIAFMVKAEFLKSLVIGAATVFGINVFINCGVVLGLLPTKGLTLPFLSYGGSSLVIYMFLFGIIVNIEKNMERNLN